mmetsp:Transcript_28181/g.59517  ORF Transcript_28181/g.59517 Transcript_28181/m.59517 type:complete len:271 (+) Transcript_28181:382-1194(+)
MRFRPHHRHPPLLPPTRRHRQHRNILVLLRRHRRHPKPKQSIRRRLLHAENISDAIDRRRRLPLRRIGEQNPTRDSVRGTARPHISRAARTRETEPMQRRHAPGIVSRVLRGRGGGLVGGQRCRERCRRRGGGWHHDGDDATTTRRRSKGDRPGRRIRRQPHHGARVLFHTVQEQIGRADGDGVHRERARRGRRRRRRNDGRRSRQRRRIRLPFARAAVHVVRSRHGHVSPGIFGGRPSLQGRSARQSCCGRRMFGHLRGSRGSRCRRCQ